MNKPIATIKAFAVELVVAIIMSGCAATIHKSERLKEISIIVNYPVVIVNDGVHDGINFFNRKDTVWIFYCNNNVLYRLSGATDLETDKKILGTETWFIYVKKATHGFLFNSITDTSKGLRLPIDSFLNKRAYANANFDVPADSLYGKVENGNDTIVEKYFARTVHNGNYPDSLYYYFTNTFENVDYSFSRRLDSAKNMKLYKVRVLYNEGFSSSYKIMLPKREFLFEMREEAIANSKQIINFFEMVKNQINE
ncbi:MAG TPA: hypothetical protein VHQ93_00130 [Chitinophagaceae bacterium]|nr:hypothetical protein [Chitinophagaceae bacterium]